ncbi:MAG: DegT/DnrJ/EryC1/StrS family aminotransferase [Pseudomonadota bacterium]
MTTHRIPVSGPWITDKEIAYVTEAAATAWYDKHNIFHERFERAFAEYSGRRHAMALPSCTAGIHLALAALGVGPGDEVIVPESTWIATAAPISYVGATPVFADVDPVSWCLSPDSFRKRITKHTRAVIPVDLYGGVPDWDELIDVAASHDVAIIEDAAEAFGSRWRSRPAGSFGVASVFSFHGSKTLTTGEGGMLLIDDDALHARVSFLRDHGRRPGDTMFMNEEVAFKYKMSSMQAALGLAQLERGDDLVRRKRQIFAWYRDRLEGVPGLRLNAEPPGLFNTYWMVTALIDGLPKERALAELRGKGIDCRPFFSPLSSIPAYRALEPDPEAARRRAPVAYALGACGVNLPSGFNLDEAQVDYVCDAVRELIAKLPA